MYQDTAAIVLHVTPHTDRACICALYTEAQGRVNALVHLSRNPRTAAVPKALLAPMTLLQASLFQRHPDEMPTLRAATLAFATPRRQTDPVRQCLAMYLSEVLYRCLRRPQEDPELFHFLLQTMEQLETQEQVQNLHLVFLMQLCSLLGFAPDLTGRGAYFDMETGQLTYDRPLHPDFIANPELRLFQALAGMSYDQATDLRLTRAERQGLLDRLEVYIQHHQADFHGTQSRTVLASLFD